ncbi:hypothetical protein AGMMS49921_12610 [Endomicrobiia bacterium]|nr:hypothetical protein AGMMS49921_12610 [Endomicrobiia bacterium]
MPGSLSLGMNLKHMGAIVIENTITGEEKNKSNVWEGESFGVDIGTIYHLIPMEFWVKCNGYLQYRNEL